MRIAADDGLGAAAELRRHAVAVDQHDLRLLDQRLHGAAHGEIRRLQDVDAVDLLDARLGHGELHDAGGDHRLVGFLALLERQLLGIVDHAQQLARRARAVDDGRRGIDRPGQRAAPGFVDAGDTSFAQRSSNRKLGIIPIEAG